MQNAVTLHPTRPQLISPFAVAVSTSSYRITVTYGIILPSPNQHLQLPNAKMMKLKKNLSSPASDLDMSYRH